MDQLTELVLRDIRKIIRAVDLHSRKIHKATNISGPQLMVLKTVSNGLHTNVVALAAATSLGQPTVSMLVKRLLEQGFLAKKRDKEDKRKFNLTTTNKGDKLLKKAPNLLQEEFIQSLQELPGWHRYMILSALEKLGELMHTDSLPDVAPALEIVTPLVD